jgi:hypothetical protein
MEKYYTFKNNDKIYYICPTCKNYFTDITYKQFYDVHYKHLHSFSIPKIEIFKMANKDNVIASSSNIKRKLSNELENINISKKQLRLNENDYNDMETKYNFNKNHVTITFPIKSTINININKKIQMKIDDEVNKLKYAKIQFGCFLTFANIENIENNTILSLSAKEYNDNFFNEIIEEINNKIEKFQQLSSGWMLKHITKIFFILTKIEKLPFLSGRSYIPSDKSLKQSLSTVNVQNYDDKCFLYAIASVLQYNNILNNRHRTNHYIEIIKTFKYKNMPMQLKDIPDFEKYNHLSINIFQYNDNTDFSYADIIKNPYVDIIYRTKYPQYKIINLLLLQKGNNYHYIGITNLDRLLNMRDDNLFIQCNWCEKCLHGFRNKITFEKHKIHCDIFDSPTTLFTMPEEKLLQFKSHQKTISPKFIIYADFESILELDSKYYQNHIPASAGLLLLGKIIIY